MFSIALVCLLVCQQRYSKSYERIAMKSYGGVQSGERNKVLDFDSGLDHHADCPIENLAITQQIMNRF